MTRMLDQPREPSTDLARSAIDFTEYWCKLFVGEHPDVDTAVGHFTEEAPILIPGLPYRLTRETDREEVVYSHLVDGRGHVHFWQVLEPRVTLAGEAAIVTYYARYCVGRVGESVIKTAKETLVLVPSQDSWRIAHMHNSP